MNYSANFISDTIRIKKARKALAGMLLFVLLLCGSLVGYRIQTAAAAPGIPLIVNYQAHLTDTSGNAITAATQMRFVIFDAVTGGACVWSAAGTGPNGCGAPDAGALNITPSAGVFSVPLGDTTFQSQNALPTDLFSDDSRYLEVQISNGVSFETLTPRQHLTAAPYALNANLLNGLAPSAVGGSGAYIPATNGGGDLTLSHNLSVGTGAFDYLYLNTGLLRVGEISGDGGLFAESGNIRLDANAGNFTWSEGGGVTNLMTLTSAGKLGVGTTTPASAVDVVGDVNVTGQFLVNGTPFSGASQWVNNGSDIYFDAGNVGIGTTAPQGALDVSAPSQITGTVDITNGTNSVVGTGTAFTSELSSGQLIKVGSEVRTIDTISDDTDLTTTANFSSDHAGEAIYRFRSRLVVLPGGGLTGGSSTGGGTLAATGNGSVSLGWTSNSSGITSSGSGSIAMGGSDTGTLSSSSDGSIALGYAVFGTLQSTASGSLAFGHSRFGGNIESQAQGSFAGGKADGGTINADADGSIALGFSIYGSNMHAGSPGAFTHGSLHDSSTMSATNEGAEAGGYVAAGGTISATGAGSYAFGAVNGDNTSEIEATGQGSFAGGSVTAIGGQTLATGIASFAFGNVVQANADNATTFGIGGINNGTSSFLVSLNGDPVLHHFNVLGNSNAFAVMANAQNQLYADPNGVGMGTASPTHALQVAGDVSPVVGLSGGQEANAQFVISGSTDPSIQLRFGVDTTNDFSSIQSTIFGNNVMPLALNADGGDVGIGTSSPVTKLDIGSDTSTDGLRIRSGLGSNVPETTSQLLFSYNNTALYTDSIRTRHDNGNSAVNTMDFYMWSTADNPDSVGSTLVMSLVGDGDVGIGTQTPAAMLSVGSTSQFQVDGSGNITTVGNETFSTTGSIMDFASTTPGNTFLWQIPGNAGSDACADGNAEGIRIFEGGNTTTQRGHICIDGPTSATPNALEYFASLYNTGATDVAENYSTDPTDNIVAGNLVAFDAARGNLFVKKAVAGAETAIGVISTLPGVKLSGVDDATGKSETTNSKPVALSGRVPTLVSNENGAIAVGDAITASSVPGVGAKSIKPGHIVGYALDSYDSATPGLVNVFIQPGSNDDQANGVTLGVDNSASNINVASSMGLTASGDLNMNGFSITKVAQISGINGQWMIDGNGVLTQVATTANGDRTLFSDSSQNVTVTLYGSGQLVAGNDRVDLTQEQKDVMAQTVPYNVVVTLTESGNGIYVTNKDNGGFNVHELDGGHSNATFDWTIIARRKGYEDTNNFGVTPSSSINQNPPSGLTGVAPTSALNDGSITGTDSDMEYKTITESTYGPVNGTSITGLTAGDYDVRYAAKSGYNASADMPVTVPAYVDQIQDQAPKNQNAPTGLTGVPPTSSTSNDGSITVTDATMEYKAAADSSYIAVTGTSISGLAAGKYDVRYAAKPGFTASLDAPVTVPAYVAENQNQNAPTGLTGVPPTSSTSNDGSITVTDATMEYKAAADSSYIAVTGTSISGLAAGNYDVRYAAKPGFTASLDAPVTVPAYSDGAGSGAAQ